VKICRVQIENYRVHRETVVDFNSVTAFIGRNGAGKSSILYAIEFFYDVSAILTADDIYAGANDEVTVTVAYASLSEAELAEFALYVRDGRLTVIKRARAGQPGRYYGIVPQLPEFARIRGFAGAREQLSAYRDLRQSDAFASLPTASSQAQVKAAMEDFERDPANTQRLQDSEREEQFFGDRRAGAGRLDNFTSFVLVPAVREAADESAKRGAIQVLVDRLVTTALANREDIVAFRQEFEERFKTLYAPENLSEIDRVSASVNKLLGRYAPGLSLKLDWQEAVPPAFGLPPFKTGLGDEDYATPIALQGHGMQRALVLSLLQLIASQPREAADEDGDSLPVNDLIIAIEEPELYLHPAQCRYLARLLTELGDDRGAPRTQVMYATHSPYFVHTDGFEQIRAVRRRAVAGDQVPCCAVGSLGFDSIQTEIARVAEIDAAKVTRESFVARCASVMDVVASEGLFASVALVVEGYGEVGCLRTVEQHLALGWDQRGIVIVPARSKNNIDRPIHIFRGLGIPCYFLFDGDISRRGGDREESAKLSNRLLMRLAGVEPEDFPATRIEATWAVLSDCLEADLRDTFDDQREWEAVSQAVRDDLGFVSVKQTLKNPDGVAEVTRRIFAQGFRLPNIERVAERVTDLLGSPEMLAMGVCRP
jgi:putative ATP-dependent endonuclease of the OLD family